MRWIMGGALTLLAVGCARSKTPAAAAEQAETQPVDEAVPQHSPAPPDIYGATCIDGPTAFGDVVMPIAERMQAEKIWYNSEDLSDCSGIFHRVMGEYAAQCPTESLPDSTDHRSSRQIGRWYLDAGLLTVVEDPVAQQDLIHPGAVLFFAPNGVDYHAMEPTEAMEKIRHLGVVVEAIRTEAGELESYRLFHGRRSNTYASITNWHRNTSKPPFGNGKDKILAVSPIATPLGPTHLERLGLPPQRGELMLTCAGERTKASDVVTPAAGELRGKTVRVRWKSEADKVRVLTLLLGKVAERCPELSVPPEEATSDHVRLAQWYVAEGHFETVDAARERGDWIVPGSVMFYGPAVEDQAGMDPEDMVEQVDHMGVVVSVSRDEAGHVVGYTVFQAPPEGAFEAQFVEANALDSATPFGLEGRAWLGVAPISVR